MSENYYRHTYEELDPGDQQDAHFERMKNEDFGDLPEDEDTEGDFGNEDAGNYFERD